MPLSDLSVGTAAVPHRSWRVHITSAAWAHVTLALCLVVALLPLLATSMPPLFDYPNHLARVDAINHWASSPGLQANYRLASFLIPNMLSDVVMLALMQVADARAAGLLLLALTFILTLGGLYLLNRAVAGRYSVWPLLAGVFLTNEMFFWGFLNYNLGLALLPWGLAAWLLMEGRPRWQQVVLGAFFALLIFLAHLVAFGLYAVAIAALELRHAWLRRREGLGPAFLRLVASASQFIPALVLYWAISPSHGLPLSPHFNFSAFVKLSPFTRLLSSGNPHADAAASLISVAALVLALTMRQVRLHPGLLLVAALFALLVLVLPYSAMESFFLDWRIAIAAAFMLLAAIVPRRPRPLATAIASMVILLLLGSRSYVLAQDWRVQGKVIGEMVAAFQRIPPGSFIIPAARYPIELGDWTQTRRMRPPPEHIVAYAMIDRQAIIPSLFAKAGQNPLVFEPLLPEMKALDRGPIARVPDAAAFRPLVQNALAVASRADEVQPPLAGVYIAMYQWGCEDWLAGLAVQPVACGQDFSVMRVVPPAEASEEAR
ncbi:hypothetical protein [Teichococcus aestuarii]|uniref:Glycosyltransferase RgtA/B/C/D-like domain-containing protein n=1 Tax=Teichococcus aestuarii TaxID=568898 RepID=A0A2U1V3F5_9PROT|nr:hypothetical protein [Pseudoroseomonas aestuarii]PWC28391.1 hypothetical protein CR165_11865 [Pseudoroseomonas aestuarii]